MAECMVLSLTFCAVTPVKASSKYFLFFDWRKVIIWSNINFFPVPAEPVKKNRIFSFVQALHKVLYILYCSVSRVNGDRVFR